MGLGLAATLLAASLIGPALLAVDPLRQDLGATFLPPSRHWLLGTDELGRSVLARLLAGGRLSLGLAGLASLATAGLGTLVGLLAAGLGGRRGRALMLLSDTIYACPALLMVLLAAGLFGGSASTVLVALALTRWPGFARLCAPLAAQAMVTPAAEASRLLGFGSLYRLRHHAGVAVRAPVASLAALQFGTNILTVASLGFLGVGLAPPVPDWGGMVADALPVWQDAPWLLAVPAAAIFLATWSATLLGEALAERDATPLGDVLTERDAAPLGEVLAERDATPLGEALAERDAPPFDPGARDA